MLEILTQSGSDPELPPPVRRLVFGEKTEEKELQALVADFYDQLERLEETHGSHYEKLELEIDGSGRDRSQAANVKLKKKTGEKPSHRTGGYRKSRKKKKDTNFDLLDRSFTLTELMHTSRDYLVDRVEVDPEADVKLPRDSATVRVEKGEAPSEEELMEEDAAGGRDQDNQDNQDNQDIGSSSKNNEDGGGSSVKENILDHTS